MGRLYLLDEDRAAAAKLGGAVNATHRWHLPGLSRCPTCSVTWAGAGHYYPGADLSQLPAMGEFVQARPEPFPEFRRLRELVRRFVPAGASLPPGTGLGPLEGTCRGELADIVWLDDVMLVHRGVHEELKASGLRGVEGYPTALRFRQKSPPELLELQLAPRGRLHSDCMPPDQPPSCLACGRFALRWPEQPILDGDTLPANVDLFRIGNFATRVVATERFVDAVCHLSLDGLTWREIPVRTSRAPGDEQRPSAARLRPGE
ncbi:double-CXXCG motif protein [Myxococcus stipitatus]